MPSQDCVIREHLSIRTARRLSQKAETVESEVTEAIRSHYTDEHEHQPTLFASLIVAHPRSCCMFWCCFYFLFTLFLTIVLTISGLDPLPTDRISEVNLNLPYADHTMRTQAFLRTKAEADYGAVQYTCRQSDPSGGYVTMFANAGDGKNVLTRKGLQYMKEVEERVLNTEGFSDYCYLNTAECSADTATSSNILKTSPTCCVYLIENVTDNNGCFLPQSTTYWFRKYGDPGFNDIEGTIALIKATSDTDYANFQAGLHKEFPNSGKSSVIRSGYMMGIPLHIANNETTSNNEDDCGSSCEQDELESIEDYLEKHLGSYLEKQYEKSPYNILYSYSGYDPLGEQIFLDLSLALIGIVAVYIYTSSMLGSLLLGSCVMFQIFMSFFGGNLIYRYLWPTDDGFGYNYFTLFQALTIFIIIGVGCDDCFVFYGVWAAGAGKYRDDVQRLSASRAHAGKAMLVTTVTTGASFLSNLQSEFPLIAAFGTFAALLVLFNFAMVVTYFPAVVMFHHSVYGEGKAKSNAYSNSNKTSPAVTATEASESSTNPKPESPPTKQPAKFIAKVTTIINTLRQVDMSDYMANTYAPWVFTYRYHILAFTSCFMIIFLVLACFVVAVPFFMYTLFPTGTNFHDISYIVQTQMSSLSSPLYAYITFGYDVDKPLEYAKDFKAYKFEFGEEGSGMPVFDTQFDISEPLTQLQLLETCTLLNDGTLNNKGLKINSNYGINPQLAGGAIDVRGGEFGIQCPMGALAKYLDVSTYHPIDGDFSAPLPSSGRWTDADTGTCKYCFTNFSASSQPSTSNGTSYATSTYSYKYPEVPTVILNTSEIIDGCNCGGLFPVPSATCLDELTYLEKGTRYRCFDSGEFAFFTDLLSFFEIQTNFDWWKDYIYATQNRNDQFDRVVMSYIKVQTTMSATDADFVAGLDMMHKWDKWANRYNKHMKAHAASIGEPEPTKAMVYIPTAVTWETSSRLAPNAISNTLVSLLLAFCVVLFATFNWIITCMAIFVVGCIVTVIFGCFYAFGWNLGILESILCVIVVGFSVDFTIHLADGYAENAGDNDEKNAINTEETAEAIRYRKVRGALAVTGVSIISGGLSTLLGTFSMMLATITFFSRFGIVMFLTMMLSTAFSLLPFAAALMVMGPLGTDGKLSNFYGPMLRQAYASLEAERIRALAHIPNPQKGFDSDKGL